MARQDLFGLSIPQLERWRTGDVVEHHKLNAPLEAIDAIVRGIRPPREVVQAQAAVQPVGGQWRMMVLIGDALGELVAFGVENVDGTWHMKGEAEFIQFWPNMEERHYQDLYATGIIGGVLEVKHHVVPCLAWDGEWHAIQLLRFAAGGAVTGAAYGDCVP